MRTLASLLFLTATLAAQSQPNIVWYTDSNPVTTGGNAFPWGSEGIRYQCIFTNAMMGNTPALIHDVFVVGDSALGDSEVVYGDIEIRMGVTPQVAGTSSWTTNNPNPTTVYRGPLRVNFRVGQWSGIGLPNSYLWLPLSTSDNLCFEVIVWSVKDRGKSVITTPNFMYTGTGAGSRVFLYQWVQNGGFSNTATPLTGSGGAKIGLLLSDGNIVTLGSGCSSSASTPLVISGDAGKWPAQGKPFNVNLSGAAPFRPAFLSLGAREDQWSGLPLPVDLAVIGAPGCRVYHDLLVTLPFVTDGTGKSVLPVGIPGGTTGFRVKASWAVLDATANPFGITTSGFATLIIGQ